MLFSPSKDYELDAASSYEIQLDRVGEINNASLKNEALIQLEVQRAERLQKQVDEHEATKQAKVERLEGLQRLLSATQQQYEEKLYRLRRDMDLQQELVGELQREVSEHPRERRHDGSQAPRVLLGLVAVVHTGVFFRSEAHVP